MKLLRYAPEGREKPGILDANGIIRDLSPLLSDLTSEYLSPSSLAKLAGIPQESLQAVSGTPLGQRPHRIYLKPGDVIELGIGHLGKQRQRVLPWSQHR